MDLRRVRSVQALRLALSAAVAFAALVVPASAWASPTSETYFCLNTIGGPGVGGLGQFGSASNAGPYGIATDAAGDVYVADPSNGGSAKVQKFRANGSPVCTIGSYGTTGAGDFQNAYGLTVGSDGVVYVLDTWRSGDSYRIQKFSSPDGGSTYSSAGQIATPQINAGDAFFIAVDAAGNMYVSVDTSAHEILKYDKYGNLVATIAPGWTSVYGVAVDAAGDLYVCANGLVNRLHSDNGVTYTVVASWNAAATGTALSNPWDVDVDLFGDVYVVENTSTAPRIVKLSSLGVPISWWTGSSTGAGQFVNPYGVAVSPGGAVCVADPGNGGTSSNHRVLRYGRDATAPVVTKASPSGWANASTARVTLAADDPSVADQYRSGMASASPLQVSSNGGSAWQDYSGPVTIATEGQTDVLYRATDAVGNVTTGTVTVSLDKTAPATTATAVPAGWSKKPVTIGLKGSDTLSGVARTEYSINNGASWTTGTSATIRTNGVTKVLYRSVDVAGNVETAKSVTVNVDSAKPLPRAMARCLVFQGRAMRLQYRVIDVSPKAKVTVEVWQGKRRLLVAKLGWKPTNASLAYVHKATLAPGMYTYKVYAKDLAGNVQAKPSTNELEVMRPR